MTPKRNHFVRDIAKHVMQSVTIVLALATPGLAQDVARIDQFVQSYASSKTFMGSVLVARANEVVFN